MIFYLLSICNDTHNCNGKSIEDVLGELERLVEVARKYGMTGIGLKQDSKTPHKSRFVHLDNLNSTTDKAIGFEGPRPWVWSYA